MYTRAIHGDHVAWIYTVEWPFFACYAVYTWWKLLHDDPDARKRALRERPAASVSALEASHGETTPVALSEGFDPYDESDPELAAYNRYLASLHERDRRRA